MSGGQLGDFFGLKQAILARAESLYPSWFPGGRKVGQEWVCGSIQGGPGESFKISFKTGMFCDFADPTVRGGDAIAARAIREGIGQFEAAKKIAREIGFEFLRESAGPPVEFQIVAPPPGERPNMFSNKYGQPVGSWTYRDARNDVLFYLARYQPPSGRKQIVPWCWNAVTSRFVQKHWPAPRPLYGLELLSDRPDAWILLVEGEKTADAARELFSAKYIPMTWCGGSSAITQVDFSPIYGRQVLLWPDADKPGIECMSKIAGLLAENGCKVKRVNPEGQPDGWDLADALSAGWDNKQTMEWAKPRVSEYQAVEVLPAEIKNDLDETPAHDTLQALWTQLGLVCGKNAPVNNADNVLRALENWDRIKGKLWYDEFYDRRFTTLFPGGKQLWKDWHVSATLILFQRELGLQQLKTPALKDALATYCRYHVRNEPKDYCETLTWDGINRLETFFINVYGCKDTAYTRAASKNFWVALAARIYEPGSKVDTMVILEGPQGEGKTTSIELIGGDWYGTVKTTPDQKDFYQDIKGMLIVEIAELSNFLRSNEQDVKSMLSTKTDTYRKTYGEEKDDNKRATVFVGTTNDDEYLKDATGGRRFWPIRITKTDLGYIRNNRAQLFAEAVHLFKNGETWWEMPKEETLAEQDARRIGDSWEPDIVQYLQNHPGFVTTKQIAVMLGFELNKIDRKTEIRISNIMQGLKYRRGFDKENKHSVRGWRPMWSSGNENTAPEITLDRQTDNDPTSFNFGANV